MKIIKIDNSQPVDLDVVIDRLRSGGVVALPTDTSYGLGANAYDDKAVRKIYAIKGRSANKPLSVMVRDLVMLGEVAEVGEREREIVKKYLPGPFTFILPKKATISDLVSGGKNTIGIRMPDFPLIQQIMAEIDFPLTATSANISGSGSIYSAQGIAEEFSGQDIQPDLIVDTGDLPPNKPSTIVDLTCDPPKILRAGLGKFEL